MELTLTVILGLVWYRVSRASVMPTRTYAGTRSPPQSSYVQWAASRRMGRREGVSGVTMGLLQIRFVQRAAESCGLVKRGEAHAGGNSSGPTQALLSLARPPQHKPAVSTRVGAISVPPQYCLRGLVGSDEYRLNSSTKKG